MIIGNSNIGRKMKKLMFIVVLLIASVSTYSQGLDTVWTYNLMPNQLTNAVFSPDEQYVFATHYYEDVNGKTTVYLSKFDKANGKLLWTTDTIMGIKQFSDDGKFFYTYNMERFSYPEFKFQTVFNFDSTKMKFKLWSFNIDEEKNIGIAINDKRFVPNGTNETDYDSSLVFFDSQALKFSEIQSHPDSTRLLYDAQISPTTDDFVTILKKMIEINNKPYYDYIIDLWNLKSKLLSKNIFKQIQIQFSFPPIVKYSPDGKLLGILTDSLRLYETGNYILMYTFPFRYVYNFSFMASNSKIMVHRIPIALEIYDLTEKNLIASADLQSDLFFINSNLNQEILTNIGYSLTLIKFKNTAISENIEILNTIGSDFVDIKLYKSIINDFSIKIFNIQGSEQKAIKYKLINENNIVVDISTLITGIYILKFQNGSEEYTHKFIIVR
jgi:hypothetical protein